MKGSQGFVPELRASVERAAHTVFDPVAREPLPSEHLALLWRLREKERERAGSSSEH